MTTLVSEYIHASEAMMPEINSRLLSVLDTKSTHNIINSTDANNTGSTTAFVRSD
jgi:hypothetical protein